MFFIHRVKKKDMVMSHSDLSQADSVFRKKYYILDKARIAVLRFILESYDGLAFARTLDAQKGIVEIAWPSSRDDDVTALLSTLEGEIGLIETDPPAANDYSPL